MKAEEVKEWIENEVQEHTSKATDSTVSGIGLRGYKCFNEIVFMIREQMSPRAIAHLVREKFGEGNDIQLESLVRSIMRFRDSNRDLLEKPDESFLDVPIETLADLKQIFRLQKERIDIDVALEKKVGKLFENTHREIKLIANIGDKILHWELDLELIGPEAERKKKEKYSETFFPEIHELSPMSRHKVLWAAQRFKEALLDEEAVDDLLEGRVDLSAFKRRKSS